MDNAVALVKAYLQINGYFTVTEYPIIESIDPTHARVATDIDILAFRFPHAGRIVTRGRDKVSRNKEQVITKIDPILKASSAQADMIIGEVKESRARLNPNMFEPSVLQSAFMRFGCCEYCDSTSIVEHLLKKGHAKTRDGHQIQIIVFGLEDKPSIKRRNYQIISLKHINDFMQRYIREHWHILKHAQFRDPALGFLIMLEKIRLGSVRK